LTEINRDELIHVPAGDMLTEEQRKTVLSVPWWYITLNGQAKYITMKLTDFPLPRLQASGCLISWSEYERHYDVAIEPVEDLHVYYLRIYQFGT